MSSQLSSSTTTSDDVDMSGREHNSRLESMKRQFNRKLGRRTLPLPHKSSNFLIGERKVASAFQSLDGHIGKVSYLKPIV